MISTLRIKADLLKEWLTQLSGYITDLVPIKIKVFLLSILNGTFVEEDYFGENEDARNKILKYAKKLKKAGSRRELRPEEKLIQKAFDRGAKPAELKLKKRRIRYIIQLKLRDFTTKKKIASTNNIVGNIEDAKK